MPSFVIVGLLGPLMPRLRSSKIMTAFLDGVNAAVVGTLAATTWTLFQTAAINLVTPVPTALLGVVATTLLLRDCAPNSTILIGIGALLGVLAQALAGRL